MNTSPKKDEGREAFSVTSDGRKVDAHIHDPILENPQAEAAIMTDYLDRLREDGVSEETIMGIAKQMGIESKAGGGPTKMAGSGSAAFFTNQSYRKASRQGMIHSPIPGRTDKIPMKVKGGSYIIPADIVSGLGQGNSLAGASALNKLFQMGPYGSAPTKGLRSPQVNYGRMNMKSAAPIRQRFEEGGPPEETAPGADQDESETPIIVAGGEFTVPPEVARRLGDGDLKHGHDILDALVLHVRQQTINEMRKLKPPKGSKESKK